MNNPVYNKTMKILRNRINVKLVNNEKDYLKCTWKQSCITYKVFDSNLVAIFKSKVVLNLNKPAYCGMCILEMSINVRIPSRIH